MSDDDIDEIEAEMRRKLADLDKELEAKRSARDRLQAALTVLTGESAPVTKTAKKPAKKKAARSFKCEQCDRSFTTKQGRSMHVTKAHSGAAPAPAAPAEATPVRPEMTYGCDLDDCNMSFFDQHAKDRHMRIVHKVHLV